MTNGVGPLDGLKTAVAERTKPIIFWIGAGLSVPAGMPTWAKLRDDLLSSLKMHVEKLTGEAQHAKSKLRAAEALKDELWRCFQLIKEAFGGVEYEQHIRALIDPGKVKILPEGYSLLAQLDPSAVLNLNIDRLATRALSNVSPIEFVGRDVKNYFHLINTPKEGLNKPQKILLKGHFVSFGK